MRFHLVYSGPLSGSGNKSKPQEAARIRDYFHHQLKLLWETHAALKRLRQTAIVFDICSELIWRKCIGGNPEVSTFELPVALEISVMNLSICPCVGAVLRFDLHAT